MIFLDVETTISNKGNAYDVNNKLVVVGYREKKKNFIQYGPYNKDYLKHLQRKIDSTLIVGFNIKFDLHWLANIGINLDKAKVWDCAIAEFLFSYQTKRYPSLDDTLEKYGFPLKLDAVSTEYWDKGINTDSIPREILTAYLIGDLEKTEQVFLKQWEQFQNEHSGMFNLFKLQCADLLTLQDMERSGVYFNTEKALAHANDIQERQNSLQESIYSTVGDIPLSLTSDRDVSTLLYGGVHLQELRVPIGVYKTGERAGETRYKKVYKTYDLPQLIVPLEKTQVKEKVSKAELELIEKGILKEPRKQYQVNEETLRMVKAKGKGKQIVDALLEFNKLEKLRTTLISWTDINKKMNWPENMLHSNFVQVTTATGRLSCVSPNQQNPDKTTKLFCETRYE